MLRENEELRHRLEEAEDTIRALRAGEVDAVLVDSHSEPVYTLETPDNSYRLLVARVPHAAVTLTADGAVIACNRRFTDLLQRPPASLRKRPIRDFVAPDSLAAIDALIRDGRTTEVRDTITLLRGDGTPASLWLSVEPLREGALGLCLMVTDLTEQRHYEELTVAQEALSRSEERLAAELADARLLQEISTRLICGDDGDALYREIVDAASVIMHSDCASMQLAKPDRTELQLLAWTGFHPDSVKLWTSVRYDARTVCAAAWRAGQRIVVPNVDACDLEFDSETLASYRRSGIGAVQSTPLLSRSGEFVGVLSTHWGKPHEPTQRDLHLLDVLARQAADLLDRREKEKALRAQQRRLQLVSDSVPALISYVDTDCRYRFCNRAYSQWFGLPREEIIGRSMREVLGEEAWKVIGPHIEAALTGTPQDFEVEARYVNGGTRWIHAVYTPDRDEEGQVRGLIVMVSDITVSKTAEQALRDADRKKDEFLATLAHELRNPLAPVRNAVQILLARGPADPLLVRARGTIDRQVRIMARLLDDLLDVSRISRNKLELRRERIALSAVIDDALEISAPVIEAAGHELALELPDAPVYLDADPVRLAQVFANLLNNAAKYTERGGKITLHAEQEGDDVVVSIRDTGIGISAEVLPYVFEIFSQARPALARAQGGLGIGLSLVKGVVELHSGCVWARSDGPGRGSEFLVRLPTSAAPLPGTLPPPVAVCPPDNSTRRRIVIADDNADSADSLAQLLEIQGHTVATAYNGEEAVRAVEIMRPDVALLDIGMPGLNGFDACRAIRKEPWGRDIYLVAVTGWGQEKDRRLTQEAGFNDHLVKPVDLAALQKLLSSLPNPSAR